MIVCGKGPQILCLCPLVYESQKTVWSEATRDQKILLGGILVPDLAFHLILLSGSFSDFNSYYIIKVIF